MKSPYEHGSGPYQDLFPNRTIFEEEERLITMGYKFLGWNPISAEVPEFRHCIVEAHNYYSAFPHAWKTKQHDLTGSDTTQWCTKDKVYWKVDMSG